MEKNYSKVFEAWKGQIGCQIVFFKFYKSRGGFFWGFFLQEVKLTQTLGNDLNHSFGFWGFSAQKVLKWTLKEVFQVLWKTDAQKLSEFLLNVAIV